MNTKQHKKLLKNYYNDNEIYFLNKEYIINNHYDYLNKNEIKEIYNLIENELKKENEYFNIYDFLNIMFYHNINNLFNKYISKLLRYEKNINLNDIYIYYNINFQETFNNKRDLEKVYYKIIEYILILLDIKENDLNILYETITKYFYKNYLNIPIDYYYNEYDNKRDMIKHIIKIISYKTNLLQLFINEIYI